MNTTCIFTDSAVSCRDSETSKHADVRSCTRATYRLLQLHDSTICEGKSYQTLQGLAQNEKLVGSMYVTAITTIMLSFRVMRDYQVLGLF